MARGNRTGPCKQQQLRSGARKPQIKPCTADISLCPLIFPFQHPLSPVPSPVVLLAESDRVPQPHGGSRSGALRTQPRRPLRALVLLLPVIFWFLVAGSNDRHCCCDMTPQGFWEHQEWEEEEEEGGARWVMVARANTCVLLGGSVSRREYSVSLRLATNPRFNVCLAMSCEGVKSMITKPPACQWCFVLLLWGYGRVKG